MISSFWLPAFYQLKCSACLAYYPELLPRAMQFYRCQHGSQIGHAASRQRPWRGSLPYLFHRHFAETASHHQLGTGLDAAEEPVFRKRGLLRLVCFGIWISYETVILELTCLSQQLPSYTSLWVATDFGLLDLNRIHFTLDISLPICDLLISVAYC